MALARIITRFAEDSQPLAEDLRVRGFEVQTRSPEEAPSEPADLEITLEECAPEEALKRATRTSDKGVCVFIAPGALTESLRMAPVIPFTPEPVEDAKPVPEPAPEPLLSVAKADGKQVDAANDVEMQPETVEDPRAVASESEPAMPKEPDSPAIAMSDLEMQPEAVENVPAMTSESFAPPEREPVLAASEPELVSAGLQSAPLVLQEPEPVSNRPIWQPDATAKEIAPEEWQAAACQAELPAQALLEEPPPEPIRVVQLPVVPDRAGFRGYKVLCKRIFSNDKVFWRTTTVAGLAAIAALLLVASAQHFSPVPAELVQSSGDIRQQVPFAKTKRSVKIQAQTKKVAPASPAVTKVEAPAAKPVVAVEPPSPGTGANNLAESKVTLASTKVRSKGRRRSSYSSEADIVAEDTVVRYGDRSTTPSPQTQKQPEVKHYSDLK